MVRKAAVICLFLLQLYTVQLSSNLMLASTNSLVASYMVIFLMQVIRSCMFVDFAPCVMT